MGSTTVNGVVKQVPYGMVRNFRDAKLERVDVVIYDANGNVRDSQFGKAQMDAGIAFYINETVKVLYSNGASGLTTICDIITVNPSTGAEAVASSPAWTAPRQKALVLKCTALNAGSGVATLTTTYEVF